MSILTRCVFLGVMFATLAGLAACANTIRGVGRDMHQTGQAIEDAAAGR